MGDVGDLEVVIVGVEVDALPAAIRVVAITQGDGLCKDRGQRDPVTTNTKELA